MNKALCPLCGNENLCRMEFDGGRCWCQGVDFAPEILARVPEAARDKACICRKCAEAASTSPPQS